MKKNLFLKIFLSLGIFINTYNVDNESNHVEVNETKIFPSEKTITTDELTCCTAVILYVKTKEDTSQIIFSHFQPQKIAEQMVSILEIIEKNKLKINFSVFSINPEKYFPETDSDEKTHLSLPYEDKKKAIANYYSENIFKKHIPENKNIYFLDPININEIEKKYSNYLTRKIICNKMDIKCFFSRKPKNISENFTHNTLKINF